MQRRERQLHLRLHANGPGNPESRCGLDHVLQQRGLAHPRLTPHQQHGAPPAARRFQQPAEHRTFRQTI
jgi:hypothetical protein